MAKSHAQRQKEYRDRKKAEASSSWLENESKRTKQYYTKVGLLSKKEARTDGRNCAKNRKYRASKTGTGIGVSYHENVGENVSANASSIEDPMPTTSGLPVQTSDISTSSTQVSSKKMIVKLPSITKRKGSSSKKKYEKKIEYMRQVQENLKKKNQALRKKISRLQKSKITGTPKSSTEKEMIHLGIAPKKHPVIRKKLVFANCLVHELNQTATVDQRNRRLIKGVIAGRILRKYKLTQYAANLTSLRVRYKSKSKLDGKKVYRSRTRTREKIRAFMEREDNARQLPGKADAVKSVENKMKLQKFVLNDYLKNIFLKYRAENPEHKVSFATFCRARPKHITLVNYAARITCLCTKHQNFALKLQSLKRLGVVTNTSPDSLSENMTIDQMSSALSKLDEHGIQFRQWKRVKCDDGKQRTKLLDIEKETAVFTEDMNKEFEEFKGHANRVKVQFQAIKQMKERLSDKKDHVCIQMDFSENYSIKEMEEIQSAYWNPESVTLHLIVMYFNNGDDGVTHSSMVAVSEVLNHNSAMVQAIIAKLIVEVKSLCPAAKFIHYWMDSPTSQYRNKTMFDLVARHQNVYGMKASWNFFESGHGKGACDGIGGVVKRTADTVIKTGKVSVHRGRDFYEWGSKIDSKIKYLYIDREEYEESNKLIEIHAADISVIKGTMKLHSVVGLNAEQIMCRDTTCVCTECFTEEGFVWQDGSQCGWKRYSIRKSETVSRETHSLESKESESEPLINTREISNEDRIARTGADEKENGEKLKFLANVEKGNYVAATYDKATYIGKVVDIDEGQYEISFMESGTKVRDCFMWPKKEDKIWIDPEDMICKVDEPIPTGKAKRFYKLRDEDRQKRSTYLN